MPKTNTRNGAGLMDLVSREPQLTKFNEAIKSAGLTKRFSGPANYTVFAPTDEAFDKLSQDRVNNLLQPENREQLKTLVLLHLVPGAFKIDDLKKVSALKTEAGREIKVRISQDSKEIKIGNAKVTLPRATTNSCCLYAVDTILQPTASAAPA